MKAMADSLAARGQHAISFPEAGEVIAILELGLNQRRRRRDDVRRRPQRHGRADPRRDGQVRLQDRHVARALKLKAAPVAERLAGSASRCIGDAETAGAAPRRARCRAGRPSRRRLLLMLALGVLPLLNLLYTSFHTVSWSGGQATFTPVGFAHYANAALRSAAARGARQHRHLRPVRRRRADGAGLRAGSAVQPRHPRPGVLSRAVHPADPGARHRHRRHLEADAQLRLRPDQPGGRARRLRAAQLARRQGDGARLASSSSTSGTGRRSASCCCWPASNRCRRISTRRPRSTALRAWQELRYVTLPLMAPAILVTFAFRLVLAFKVFDEVYLLTGRRAGHRDRGLELHALPALLHGGPRRLRRARWRWPSCSSCALLLVVALSARRRSERSA